MSDTTNDFYKYWNQAEPLTIFEQKPLYDFEKEAMNVYIIYIMIIRV